MVSCRDIISGIGAGITSAGFGYFSLTAWRAYNDKTIAQVASICQQVPSTIEKVGTLVTESSPLSLVKNSAPVSTVLSYLKGSTKLAQVGSVLKSGVETGSTIIKAGAEYVLPNGARVTRDALASLCESATRINDYGLQIAIGAGLLAAGCATFALSRCISVKVKAE